MVINEASALLYNAYQPINFQEYFYRQCGYALNEFQSALNVIFELSTMLCFGTESRQIGKSVYQTVRALYHASLEENAKVLVICPSVDMSRTFTDRLRQYGGYAVQASTPRTVLLKNGSTIDVMSAEQFAKRPRGILYDLMIGDEVEITQDMKNSTKKYLFIHGGY